MSSYLAPVIILDFAGQEVFYSTHQSFHTHQGIYVLVINGSLNLDSEIPSESFIPGRHGNKSCSKDKFEKTKTLLGSSSSLSFAFTFLLSGLCLSVLGLRRLPKAMNFLLAY
jgi:hypothetical protein